MFTFKLVGSEIVQYRTFDQVITFFENTSKKLEARVQKLFNDSVKSFFVVIPSSEEIDKLSLEKPITPKRQIRYLLKNHYYPIVQGETLTFSCALTQEILPLNLLFDHTISVLQTEICSQENSFTCSVPEPILLRDKQCDEDPDIFQMYDTLAEAYLRKEAWKDALQAYTDALKHTREISAYERIPQLYLKEGKPLYAALAYLYLAKAYLQKESQKVLDNFCKAIEFYQFPEQIKLAISLILRNENEKACDLFIDIANSYIKQYQKREVLYFYELGLFCNPSKETAKTIFENLINFYDYFLQIENMYIRAMLHFGSDPLSLEFYLKARECFPKSPYVILAYLSTLSREHRYHDYQSLASLYKLGGQNSQCIAVLQKLIRFGQDVDFEQLIKEMTHQTKDLEDVFITWINHLVDQKNYFHAEEITQKALAKLPQDFLFLQRLYDITQNLPDPQKKALAALQLGEYYERENALAEAEKFYLEAFQIQKTCQTTCRLADLFFKQGRQEESIRTYFDASADSFVREDFEAIDIYYRNAEKLDPNLTNLSSIEKILFKMIFERSVFQSAPQNVFSTSTSILEEGSRNAFSSSLVPDPLLKQSTSYLPIFVPDFGFGKEKWEQYVGNVEEEPPLPLNTSEILNGICPIWKNDIRIRKTHLLFFIPKSVNGRSLSLSNLVDLVSTPKMGLGLNIFALNCSFFCPNSRSRWILITKDAMPIEKQKSDSSKEVPSKFPNSYRIPYVIEIATAISMHFLQTGEILYKDRIIACYNGKGLTGKKIKWLSPKSEELEGRKIYSINIRDPDLSQKNQSTSSLSYVLMRELK